MRDEVTLAPGAQEAVPIEVRVPSDAWADRPVRVSARIRNSLDAQTETWQDIAIERELPPVGASLDWPLPDSLVGGFNVAWSALGSRWVGSSRPGTGNYENLFNDLVYGRIMACCGYLLWVEGRAAAGADNRVAGVGTGAGCRDRFESLRARR